MGSMFWDPFKRTHTLLSDKRVGAIKGHPHIDSPFAVGVKVCMLGVEGWYPLVEGQQRN